MELIIILVVVIFLIGTVGIALPSKSSRKISDLRMNATKMGFRIIPNNLGKSLFKNNDLLLVTYQLKNTTNLEEAHFIRDKDKFILYSPVKLKYSDSFDSLNIMLEKMSDSLDEIIFTKSSVSFLWKEKKGIEELKLILVGLKKINLF